MRDTPRSRRAVSPGLIRALRPLFRFSPARGAYVLRVGGGSRGPVLVDRSAAEPIASRRPVTRPVTRDGADVADGPPKPAEQPRS
ncbi:MAG: hypothetical protein JHC95_02195 [Solirubrobacteraceae bacterium]|nr:hypothetical protein [Solirubrobacteraceae bacterium]